jgi:hypothetical protein
VSRSSPLIVLERAVLVHELFQVAGVPHAIGGALALAYHVGAARATDDIDLNVTSDLDHPELVYRLLPPEVPWGEDDVRRARERGNVRLLWPHPDGPPTLPIALDLFFPEHEFHELVSRRAEWVPMLDATVPILSATDLMVFKMLFDRRKDWADIEELVRYGKADLDQAGEWVRILLGGEDLRHAKLAQIVSEVGGHSAS